MFDCSCSSKAAARLCWVGPLLLNRPEIGRVPDGIMGVYLLHHFDVEIGGYPIFYVGKADDIKRRLSQHIRLSTAKARISAARRIAQTYFSAAPVSPIILQRVEASLIQSLRPICNDLIPAAEPLLVNLPRLFL